MQEKIIEILENVKPGIEYSKETNLISDEIITSFDLVMLVSLLNEEFNINIGVTELIPENFENIESIENLIKKLS